MAILDTTTETQVRIPVVVVMGHIDHGKTSLLDKIRKTGVAARESGGITQHIGAYQVPHEGKHITFLDTPGHEAFSAIRSRGARVADVAVLVVAADEGVKPQTLEALSLIGASALPFVVAINKMDRPGANPDKVKGELAEHNVLVEGWGGQTPVTNVSALTGEGIPELLEVILLLSELERAPGTPEEDEIHPSRQLAHGVVIESSMDQRRGALATVLVQEGVLTVGMALGAGKTFGRVRTLEDWDGRIITQAPQGMPVRVVGFKEPPAAGDICMAFPSTKEAEAAAQKAIEASRSFEPSVLTLISGKREHILYLVVRADVEGSLEGIIQSLKTLPIERVGIEILKHGLGNITDADLKIAEPKHALVIGFRVGVEPQARAYGMQRKVPTAAFTIIYELIEFVRQSMAGQLPPEVIREDLGALTVLALFQKTAKGQIAGGKVTKGKVKRGALVEIVHQGEAVAKGRLVQLQQGKNDAEEVGEGRECGILVESQKLFAIGDTLNFFEEVTKVAEL